jgi:tetratricopeptide (TPR) repeat protein
LNQQRIARIKYGLTVWTLAALLTYQSGCAQWNARRTDHRPAASQDSPHYRHQRALPIYIQIAPGLTKVRGIKRYILRQVAQVNAQLLLRFEFRLQPVFAQPSQQGLTVTFVEQSAQARPIKYGRFNFELALTLQGIARPLDESLSRAFHDAVLEQLGLPPPCLSKRSLQRDDHALRLIVEGHLSRQGNAIHISPTPLHQLAQSILKGLSALNEVPACFHTLIGRERLHLWQDVNTQPRVESRRGPQFLRDAHKAIAQGSFDKAYRLCAPEAEGRPQTGAARCAARAAQGLEHYQEASRMWRAHLAFFPDDQEGIIALARCIGRLGDDDSARAILQISTHRFPEWVDAKIELGIALYRLNQIETARQKWRAALSIDPDNVDAQRLLRQY